MITLTKSGNAIVFTFDDNDHYLNDGTIEVPVNSLTLVTDESQMATFKRSSTNDIFISARYDELGMSKSDLESWFKENAFDTGVTPEEVQDMIDESTSGLAESSAVTEEISEAVSGKADTSDVQNVASDVATVSGDVNTLSGSVNALTGAVNTLSGDVSTLSGQVETDEKVTANALVDLNNRKLDASAYTPTDLSNYYTKSQTSGATQISTALGDKADTSAVTASIAAAVSGKQDTLIAGSGITIDSANTISCTVEGGGKAIEAGRGIAITTGATADTVSFNLPISGLPKTTTAVTDNNLVIFGTGNTVAIESKTGQNFDSNIVYGNNNVFQLSGIQCGSSYNTIFGVNNEIYNNAALKASSKNNLVYGSNNKVYGNNNTYNFLFGDNNQMSGRAHITVFGTGNNPKNQYETIFGKYSVSHSGSTDADKSLFSVGNGTSTAATHNAFEIRQNGDIYITSGGTDIKLQDNLGGGGGSSYTAGDGIDITSDVISVTGKVDTSAITTSVTSASTDVQVPSAKAVYDQLGGLKLVSLTQAEYDALVTKDSSTLYIITNVVN